jgi:hypothetical protein
VPGCTKPDEIAGILRYYTCPDEERDFGGAVLKSRWSVTGNCQYCNHCLPCCRGINIGLVNRLLDARAAESSLHQYQKMTAKASGCDRCGGCEERCPFKVPVRERMKQAVDLFEK